MNEDELCESEAQKAEVDAQKAVQARWEFGYTRKQILQIAADIVAERLGRCANNRERAEFLADCFPDRQPLTALEVAQGLLEERDYWTHADNGGRMTVEQFELWCKREAVGP